MQPTSVAVYGTITILVAARKVGFVSQITSEVLVLVGHQIGSVGRPPDLCVGGRGLNSHRPRLVSSCWQSGETRFSWMIISLGGGRGGR